MSDHTTERSIEKSEDTVPQAGSVKTTSRPTPRRRTLLFQILFFLGIVGFSFLTFVVETTPSLPIDIQITRAIQTIDSPLLEGLMWLISWPGFLPQSLILTVLIAVALYAFGLRWEAITSLLAAMLSGGINQLIKELIARPRPAVHLVDVFEVLTSYSFPSGHVMFYTVLFGFLWYLAFTTFKRSLLRSFLLVLLGGLILLVGVSRIYMGQHWASDVLGAYLLGGLIVAGVITLYQWGKTKFFIHRPGTNA